MAPVSEQRARAVICVLLAVIAVVAAASYDRERLEIAKQILEEVPLTDGHNDLAWNIRKFLRNQINKFELDTDLRKMDPWAKSKYSHTDLPRLREGMVGAQGTSKLADDFAFKNYYFPPPSQKDSIGLERTKNKTSSKRDRSHGGDDYDIDQSLY